MPEKSRIAESRRRAVIAARLRDRYPEPVTMLHWRTPWELLAATMLSAQCTDERVNRTTPALFERFPDAAAMAQADVAEVERLVYSTGFYRDKARHLVAAARLVTEAHGGEPPRTMEELTRLPGVARKTANIVLANAYGVQEGVAVDTHVKRLAWRLGLTASRDAKRIEADLMAGFPREDWGRLNHWLVLLGREICPARRPRCEACPLADVCPRRGVENDKSS